MSDPIVVSPSTTLGESIHLEPIHLDVAGVKFDLPNMNDSRFPLDLIPAAALIRSADVLTDQQKVQVTAMFMDYIQRQLPRVWAAIRKQDEPLAWIAGLIETWAKQSAIDPKV